MRNADAFMASLEAVAARCDDPAPLVYAALFARHPELEVHFEMDTDGGVRGSMLQQTFDVLLDLADGPGILARSILSTERVNHDSYGVDPATFDLFLPVLHDVCRQIAADAWTPDMDAAWTHILKLAHTVSAE